MAYDDSLPPQRSRTTRLLDDRAVFLDADPRSQAPVMVIDDSPAVRRVVEISLYRVGIPVVSFEDGIDAFAALSSGEIAPPKVVLLDIGLPRMNGYDVARRLKNNPSLRDVKIIMLTGHNGMLNRMYSRVLGADFIAKPFKSHEVVAQVCLALGISVPDHTWRS